MQPRSNIFASGMSRRYYSSRIVKRKVHTRHKHETKEKVQATEGREEGDSMMKEGKGRSDVDSEHTGHNESKLGDDDYSKTVRRMLASDDLSPILRKTLEKELQQIESESASLKGGSRKGFGSFKRNSMDNTDVSSNHSHKVDSVKTESQELDQVDKVDKALEELMKDYGTPRFLRPIVRNILQKSKWSQKSGPESVSSKAKISESASSKAESTSSKAESTSSKAESSSKSTATEAESTSNQTASAKESQNTFESSTTGDSNEADSSESNRFSNIFVYIAYSFHS